MDAYLGEIRVFPFARIPQGWLPCDGRLLAVAEHQVMFQLLGRRYGGDGMARFALPDLQGRVPVGFGQVMGGVTMKLGVATGAEAVALSDAQVPPHGHTLMAAGVAATTSAPGGAALAQPASAVYGPFGGGAMAADVVEPRGAGAAHSNMQPSLVLCWCIAVQGELPSL